MLFEKYGEMEDGYGKFFEFIEYDVYNCEEQRIKVYCFICYCVLVQFCVEKNCYVYSCYDSQL